MGEQWLLLTWACTLAGCEPLPSIGPMAAEVCRIARPGFLAPSSDPSQHPRFWIEARCTKLQEPPADG